MRDMDASSLHALFVEDDEREFLCARGFAARLDCQFHWRNLGFATFDDFLGTFGAVGTRADRVTFHKHTVVHAPNLLLKRKIRRNGRVIFIAEDRIRSLFNE